MIINLSNFGGGGGGYVLPIASSEVLGGVMIGSGINVDSDGTISVSGSGEAQMALALKSTVDGGMKVVNENGCLYNVEEYRDDEDGIFVKIKQEVDMVRIYIDLSGQTAPEGETIDIVSFGDVTITLNENGELFYLDEESNEVYFDVDDDYTYGDFTFHWSNDGKDIDFIQNATSLIFADQLTGNCDLLYMIARDLYMASGDDLGLVKIGEGINLSEDGTISVEASEPSVIKSVSALPQIAADGDVVSYSNQLWEYKATSGTSCVINDFKGYNEYGDIVINYYSLPENQVLFHFTTNFGFDRYVSYSDGVFTLWEDSGMTTSAETITEGSDFDFWWGNVPGISIPGLMRLTSMQNQNGNINLSVSIVGNWNVKPSGHWEPGDWEDQVNSAPLYKVNRVKSSPFATVEGDGINPKMLTQVDGLYDRTLGVVPMSSLSGVFTTDSSGFTCDLSCLPSNNVDNIRLVNIYLGGYQIEFNFYQGGVMFENKDTDHDWQVVSSGVIQTNTSSTTWDSGEAYEMTSSLQNNVLSVHYTTDVGFDVQNIPVVCLMFNNCYNPIKLR